MPAKHEPSETSRKETCFEWRTVRSQPRTLAPSPARSRASSARIDSLMTPPPVLLPRRKVTGLRSFGMSESHINWFPGHMNKARREIAAAIARIDVVIEMLDARLPHSSANPMLETLRGGRPCLRVLGKADLADPAVTSAWLTALTGRPDLRAIPLDASRAGAVRGVPRLCRELAPHRRGPGKPVRCLVVGIPNVGKSTLINSLVGRRVAKVITTPPAACGFRSAMSCGSRMGG